MPTMYDFQIPIVCLYQVALRGMVYFILRDNTSYSFHIGPFKQTKNVTENILSLIDKLGTTVLSTKVTGQKKTSLKGDALTLTLQRKAPGKIGGETLSGNENEGAVTFPSKEALFGRNGAGVHVDMQVGALKLILGKVLGHGHFYVTQIRFKVLVINLRAVSRLLT